MTDNAQIATDGYNIPRHVAIIMDGNGRWAKARGLPRTVGHKKGVEALEQVLQSCRDIGIEYLTLYAFSSENWQRSPEEVKSLMMLLSLYISKELKRLHKEGVRLRIIGDRSRLQSDILKKIEEAELLTKDNTVLNLTVAISYGSRQEILRAAKLLCQDVLAGSDLDEVSEEAFSNYLYTKETPDPDLLIRTGGEQRISNYLLWQMAYTELCFLDIMWPDFGKSEFEAAIAEFGKRERRYGTA
jgi:undecaprenyl diphosphate synthase